MTPDSIRDLQMSPYGQYSLRPGIIIAERYKLLNRIDGGSFGQIYLAYDKQSKVDCVVKFEIKSTGNLLQREIKILNQLKGICGFPQLIFSGRDSIYQYFMETLLGPNLEEIFKQRGRKFQMSTILQIAIQMMERIEVFHCKNLIHRDLKPENLVIGREDNHLIYIIDFGLSKYYRDENGDHIVFQSNKGMIGTARYSSINALEGREQSRRDDLESIGYILIYFIQGKLPWMNIQADTKREKLQKILQKKISSVDLCKDLPECFFQYFEHILCLEFEKQPNYTYLKQLFSVALDQIEEKKGFLPLEWEDMNFKDILLFKQQKSRNDISALMSKQNSINKDIIRISPIKVEVLGEQKARVPGRKRSQSLREYINDSKRLKPSQNLLDNSMIVLQSNQEEEEDEAYIPDDDCTEIKASQMINWVKQHQRKYI